MDQEIEQRLLIRLNDHLANHVGLNFAPDRLTDFRNKLKAVSKEFGMEPVDCANWLLSSALTEEQIHTLSYHLTIGETYFFRDPKAFEVLEDEVLAKLIRQRRNSSKYLRIWSAGCCTGEEPYSIAIMLKRMLPDIQSWRISILGTDINPQFLKKAQRGIYEPWSFRITSPEVKNRFFTHVKGKYEIIEDVKQMVQFAQLNLIDEKTPNGIMLSSIDIIFCRNVLIYFHPDQTARVWDRLHGALSDDGTVVSTPFELSSVPAKLFTRLQHKGAVLFTKRSASADSKDEERTISALTSPGAFEIAAWRPIGASPTTLNPTDLRPTNSNPLAPTLEQLINRQPLIGFQDSRELHESKELQKAKASTKSPSPAAEIDVANHAKQLFESKQYQQCISFLLPLCSTEDLDAGLAHLLSRAYSNHGDLAGALRWVDRSIAKEKLNHSAYLTKANILQAQGNIQEALTALRQALFLDPKCVIAEFQMATVLLQIGKLQESRKRLQGALTLLSQYNVEEVVPETEDLTAGALAQIIKSLLERAASRLSGGQ
jgi:chemotaxis protein methyltransferase CheR